MTASPSTPSTLFYHNHYNPLNHDDCAKFWDQLDQVVFRPQENFDTLISGGDREPRDDFYSGVITTGDRFVAKSRCSASTAQEPNLPRQPPTSQLGRGAPGVCHPVGVAATRGAPVSVGTVGLRPVPQLEYIAPPPHPTPPRMVMRNVGETTLVSHLYVGWQALLIRSKRHHRTATILTIVQHRARK
jgi:hypothetical protein